MICFTGKCPPLVRKEQYIGQDIGNYYFIGKILCPDGGGTDPLAATILNPISVQGLPFYISTAGQG